MLIDVKAEWANAFCGLQTKLFVYCNFLASQTGRACFYFYVGSISLFLLQIGRELSWICHSHGFTDLYTS